MVFVIVEFGFSVRGDRFAMIFGDGLMELSLV